MKGNSHVQHQVPQQDVSYTIDNIHKACFSTDEAFESFALDYTEDYKDFKTTWRTHQMDIHYSPLFEKIRDRDLVIDEGADRLRIIHFNPDSMSCGQFDIAYVFPEDILSLPDDADWVEFCASQPHELADAGTHHFTEWQELVQEFVDEDKCFLNDWIGNDIVQIKKYVDGIFSLKKRVPHISFDVAYCNATSIIEQEGFHDGFSNLLEKFGAELLGQDTYKKEEVENERII